jgi:hypothetical protein
MLLELCLFQGILRKWTTQFGRKTSVGFERLQRHICFEKLCKGKQISMVGACRPTFFSSFFLLNGCSNFVEIYHGPVPNGVFQFVMLHCLGFCRFALDLKSINVFGVF